MDIDYQKIIIIILVTLVAGLLFKKQREMIFGAGAYRGFGWFFDNPIWISAQLIWGARGVLVMAITAILINISFFVYFRNKEAKFILWSSLKEFSEREDEYRNKFKEWRGHKTPWRFILLIGSYIPMKIFFFLLKVIKVPFWGNFFALIALSIFEDPFIATTYIRHGNKKELDFKIVIIFLISILISIGYWSIRNGLITEFVIRPIVS